MVVFGRFLPGMVVVVVLARKRREVAMMPISCLGLTIPDSLERDGHQSFEKESENGEKLPRCPSHVWVSPFQTPLKETHITASKRKVRTEEERKEKLP